MKNKQIKVIFCLPGFSFSGMFLECWTYLFAYCLNNNIQPIISHKESCNIYYARNMCLGASVSRGKGQKPFNGQIDYDYIMWIDSDIVFIPQHFQKLLSHKKEDIVSGIYMKDDGKHFAICKEWDEEYFKKHGHFEFLTLKDINEKEVLMEVSYTGMGFMLVKKGVFESLEYPWFSPIEKKIGNMDLTLEDVSFCFKAKENGFKIFIDQTVIVGHEKKVLL